MSKRSRANAELDRIIQLESECNIAGLIAELRSDVAFGKYNIIRSQAAEALARIGDPRAVPHIAELADDPEEIVRMTAFDALGELKAQGVDRVLLKGLKDEGPMVRMAAAEALGRANVTEGIPLLRGVVLGDSNPEVRLHAAEALVMLGDKEVLRQIPTVIRGVSWRVRGHPRWKRLAELAKSG